MKFEIDFPFHSYTIRDLVEFCYGKHADVDTAIPTELYRLIKEFTGELNAHQFYVMDYTDNKAFGKLVNLKEKFFERVALLHEEQLPKSFEDFKKRKEAKVIPFRFWLDHDKGMTKILVYSSDELSARQLIMEAENCPDSAIRLRRA
jgi:hypothetical protein